MSFDNKQYKMPFEQLQAQSRGAREGTGKIIEFMDQKEAEIEAAVERLKNNPNAIKDAVAGKTLTVVRFDDDNVPRPLFYRDDPMLEVLKPFLTDNREQMEGRRHRPEPEGEADEDREED